MDYVLGMENIVMKDRRSYLVQVYGEDAVYVVGFFIDIRGLRVCTDETKFAKDEIALRIKIGEDREPSMPGPGQLSFDHHTNDYVGV